MSNEDRNELVQLIDLILRGEFDESSVNSALIALLDSSDIAVSQGAHTAMHYISDRDLFERDREYQQIQMRGLHSIVASLAPGSERS